MSPTLSPRGQLPQAHRWRSLRHALDEVMPFSTASLNRELNRKQLSQPDAVRINLRLPGPINGR